MVRFWSLSRGGLAPVGCLLLRPWPVLRAAVASCGLPRPFLRFELQTPAEAGGYDGRGLRLAAGLVFSSGGLFRCEFAVSRAVDRRAFWLRAWFALVWLWLLPVRVTEYAECPLMGSQPRWAAFVDALRAPPSLYLP